MCENRDGSACQMSSIGYGRSGAASGAACGGVTSLWQTLQSSPGCCRNACAWQRCRTACDRRCRGALPMCVAARRTRSARAARARAASDRCGGSGASGARCGEHAATRRRRSASTAREPHAARDGNTKRRQVPASAAVAIAVDRGEGRRSGRRVHVTAAGGIGAPPRDRELARGVRRACTRRRRARRRGRGPTASSRRAAVDDDRRRRGRARARAVDHSRSKKPGSARRHVLRIRRSPGIGALQVIRSSRPCRSMRPDRPRAASRVRDPGQRARRAARSAPRAGSDRSPAIDVASSGRDERRERRAAAEIEPAPRARPGGIAPTRW